MKKVVKKEKEYTSDDMKHYLGALQEHHDDQFKVVQESFLTTNQKFDTVFEKLDAQTEMIGGLAERMGRFELTMTIIQEDVGFIKNGMKRKVDYEEFEALLRRVLVIERRVLK